MAQYKYVDRIVEIMSVIGTVYEDVTTDVIGKIGTWQWLITFVSAAIMFSTMFNQYEDMFLLHAGNVNCMSPSEFEVHNSSLCYLSMGTNSSESLKCNTWNLQILWVIWLRRTWLVFCADKLKLLTTAIISRFGLVFGCIIFGLISDSFGRRQAIILDVLAELICGLIITFCDSESWFSLVAFLKSVFGSANFYMGIILVCEIASNEWRSWLCVIVMSPRLLRMICMIPLANTAPNTQSFSFIACLYSFICLIFLLRWSPESPQWLIFNRKIAIAEKILANSAKINGIKLCNNFKIRPINHKAYNSLDETTTCLGIISTHNIRCIFLLATLFWNLYYFLWSSLYVRMYTDENISYLLLQVFGCLGVLACLTIFSSLKLQLRYILLTHILITGFFTASVTLFRKGTARTLIASVALASGLLGHALLLNITPRLFAINVRATVFGCCHATGQIGSIVSYLVFFFQPINEITLMTVQLVITIILASFCVLLPEVEGRELPDLLRDMDYFSELSKPLRWVTQKTDSPSREEVQIRVYSFGSIGYSQSNDHSNEGLPPQNIGFTRLWHMFTNCCRRKLQIRRITDSL